MAATSEDDGQTYFILGLAVGIIALVLFLVIGIALYKTSAPKAAVAGASGAATMAMASAPAAVAATPKVAEVTETVVVTIPDGASVRVDNGVVKFYFATGSTDLAPGAAEALAAVIKGVEGGKKAVVSGYHDDTGDAAKNAELAKQRAGRIQEVLVGLGVPADKVELKKPEGTTGTGSNAEARRVEVKLVD